MISKMSIDQIVEVVTAFRDGKKVQSRQRFANTCWGDTNSPDWNFSEFEYRLKREPREFWIVDHRDHEVPRVYSCEQKLWSGFTGEQIHVLEVIPD